MRLLLCVLVWCAARAQAVEVHIHYTALARILAEQVFTQDGRKYVRGAPAVKCNYAYLEHPEVRGADGRLRVQARFSGRSALDLFGRCVGLGDSFDLSITGVPYYRDGAIRFQDLRVESKGRDGFYIRRVRAALADTLRRQFEYRVAEDARKILEEKRGSGAYRQEVSGFSVSGIHVTPDALILVLDFTVAVK
jgi:hypothetical protein